MLADEAGAAGKISYLEALRGLAALQVVAQHVLPILLLPVAVSYRPDALTISPLTFLYDGLSAVYLFFVLSGYVLTVAFEKRFSTVPQMIAARYVRLAVPTLASCLMSAVLFALLFLWLSGHFAPGEFVRVGVDALWNGLLVGYRHDGSFSLLGLSYAGLPEYSASFNAVIWTLSIEFAGSILIIVLIACRRLGTMPWLVLLALAVAVLARSPMLTFLAGHVAARLALATRKVFVPRIVSAALFGAGLYMCVTAIVGFNWGVTLPSYACILPPDWMPPCGNAVHLQKSWGAILIFLAVVQSNGARAFLSAPRLTRLGHYSFAIYLAHWPALTILSGLVTKYSAPPIAMLAGLAVAIAIIVPVAGILERIDRHAIRWARLVQGAIRRPPAADPRQEPPTGDGMLRRAS